MVIAKSIRFENLGLLLCSALILLWPTSSAAQTEPAKIAAESPPQTDNLWQVDATAYEPSPAFPFGRPHPDAPAELAQFAFFIGAFDCVDTLRQPDGSKIEFPAIWNARYFLNGHAIQDQYWSPTFSTSNIRVYDPQAEAWNVTFFRMPGFQSGVWVGQQVGETIQLRAEGKTNGPALTFHNIRENGFDWNSGGENPGWTSSCTRR